MNNLILDSLAIENFKAFKRLTIDRLGRVNLIVGKNNVGKTCLLEALWFQVTHGDTETQKQILQLRHEFVETEKLISQTKNFIYGREEATSLKDRPIKINTLTFPSGSPSAKQIPCLFIPTIRFTPKQIKELWLPIELTPSEDYILQALQIIEPKVLRISLREKEQDWLPIVRLSGGKEPVFLSSLGEGVNHLFYFALALANVENGILLIDEIENGLHYSIQPQVWQFIFEMAQRLNVQVFATTHSWDCIEAFQQVVQECPEPENLLISLWEVKGKAGEVVGVLADKEKLKVIVQAHIEVR